MELLAWRDEFSTGIPGVDYEHEELIASINAFYDKVSDQSGKDVLVNALNDIYGEIYSHFVLEEKMMEKHGYDAYEEHRGDHARLLDDIRDITTGLEQSSEYNEDELKQKLTDWFGVHFQSHDARLHKLEQQIAAQADSGDGLIALAKKVTGNILK